MSEQQAPLYTAVEPAYTAYLHDESLYTGMADTISFPAAEEEIRQTVLRCAAEQVPITIQGSRTGIVGAAVPNGGHILNLSKFNRILEISQEGTAEIEVEAGATGEEIERAIRQATRNKFYLPALPTEKTATVGGMLSGNAAGLQSYRFGPLRNAVRQMTVCTAQGEKLTLKADSPQLKEWLSAEGGLGVITSVRLALTPKAAHTWGLFFFFSGDETACAFADRIDGLNTVTTLEYMDERTITCIERYRKNMNAIADLPAFPQQTKAVIFVEIAADSEEELEEAAGEMIEAVVEIGEDPDTAWAMSTEAEVETLRAYRHAASECVNMTVAEAHASYPEITKLSADLRWPQTTRLDLLRRYQKEAEKIGVEFCIFGHLGSRQPYVNFMAKTPEEYQAAKELLLQWTVDAMQNGQAFLEHGVGKLKRDLFFGAAAQPQVETLRAQKSKWDAAGVFGSENLPFGSLIAGIQ